VAIVGDGVAACCCAHILGTGVEAADRARVPALIVGEPTQRLIADIFEREDVFDGMPRIERRVVAWGGEPVALPHRAVVIAEDELVRRLRPAESTGDLNWTIHTARPLPPECVEHHFGTRMATASAVVAAGDASTFWIESLPAGWLFLLPGWLLAVGGGADALLAESRLIAPQIRERGPAGAMWPAHPRIVQPLCGDRWLACGTAAMGFDPICGDGTGYAVREGILAAAVVKAVAHGEDAASLRDHYVGRTMSGFRRHLELCREYYRTGGAGAWWRSELEALERGIAWCGRDPEFRYRLNGFELQRL
jgi:hypothetical protein